MTGEAVSDAGGETLTRPILWLSYLKPGYDPLYFVLNSKGDLVFPYEICCGTFAKGIFKVTLPVPAIPNGGFENAGASGRPESFETAWNNAGQGEASQANSNGADSFEGNSCLRLHVHQEAE